MFRSACRRLYADLSSPPHRCGAFLRHYSALLLLIVAAGPAIANPTAIEPILRALAPTDVTDPRSKDRAGQLLVAQRGPAVDSNPAQVGDRARALPADLIRLVDQAWRISRQAESKSARGDELGARSSATNSYFAGAPSVSLDVRRDLPRGVELPGTQSQSERGKNEWEPGFSAPIWLPGQRDAQRRVIDRDRELLDSSALLARWRLAGEVRDLAWRLRSARVEDTLQKGRLSAALALETDVQRRVAGGDLARTDLWLAQVESRAAQAAVIEAQAKLEEARIALAAVTGLEDPGNIDEPSVAADPNRPFEPDAHPLVVAATQTWQAARARLDYASSVRRDNPTFSVVGRFDRDGYDSGYRNTVRMGISVPLDTVSRNAPKIAAAATESVENEVALHRERRQVVADYNRARLMLQAAVNALEQYRLRQTLAADTVAAFERSFRAGERSLPDLLRVRALALDAQLAKELAQVQAGLAVARLNQASGVTP